MTDLEKAIIEINTLKERVSQLEKQNAGLIKVKKLLWQVEEIASVGHYEIGIDFEHVFWSAETFRIFGLDPSGKEPTLEEYRTFIFPDDIDKVYQMFEFTIKDSGFFNLEYRIIRSDKEIRYVHSHGHVIVDTDNTILLGTIRDITEYKKSQYELQESREKFRILFDNAPLGYQSLDIDGNFIEVNEAWCNVLGYAKGEVLGKNFSEFIHPDFSEHFKANFPKFKSLGYILGVEFEMVKKDGGIITVAFNGKIGTDETGNFKQTHCIFSDITAKKRAEEALRESYELNKQIINCAGEGIIVYGRDLNYLVWNPYMEELTGKTAGEVIGKNPEEVFPFYKRTGINKKLKSILNGSESKQQEYEFLLPGREKCWITDRNSPLVNTRGEIIGVIGIVNNITPRKKYEEELYLNSLVLNQIQDCVSVTDTNGIITYVNQAETKIIGYSKEEIIGKSVHIFGESESFGASQDTIISQTLQNGSWRGEIVNKRKDGTEIILDCRAHSIYDSNGKPIALCGISTDITERIKTEIALRESEEKYRLLHENAGIGIGYFQPDGTLISFNQIAAKLMNGKPEEFTGKNIYDLYPKANADIYFERIQIACKKQSPQVYEDLVNLPKKKKWFLSTFTKITGYSDKILGIQIISQDISELKEKENAIKESENKYRALFNNLAEGVALNEIIYNESGEMIDYRILEVNKAFYETADYSPGQVIGKKATELYGLDSYLIKSFWHSHKYSKSSAFTEMFSPLGSKHYYIITSPFENDRFITSFLDISERKAAEDALKASEEKFRQIVESSSDIFYRQYIENGQYEYISPKMEAYFGYTIDELLLMNFFEQLNCIHPDDIIHVMDFRKEIVDADSDGRHFIEKEFRLRKKSGEYKWIHGNYFLVRDNNNEPYLIVGSLQDITERKTNELKLFELNKQMAKAQEIALLGFWTYDTSNRVVTWSDEMYNIFGMEKGIYSPELDGMHNYFHPDDRDTFVEGMELVLSHGETFHNELRIIKPEGILRYIVIVVEAAEVINGSVKRIFSVLQDITSSRLIEDALRQSEKRFLDISASIPGAIFQFVIKQDGSIEIPYMSRSGVSLFEMPLEELQNPSYLFSNLHPEDLENMWASIRESSETMQQWSLEFRIRLNTGEIKWLNGCSIPNKLSDGSTCWNGVMTEITKNKISELELIKSSERYQNFVQNAYEGIYLTVFDNAVDTSLAMEEQIDCIYENAYMAECNQALAKMYNFEKVEDLVGRRMIDFHGGIHYQVNRQMFKKFIESGYKLFGDETHEQAPDGSILYFSNNAVGIVENGYLTRIWGTALDITSNKKAEHELKESEEKYRRIVETANEGICSIDKNHIIVFVNSKMAEILNFEPDELLGKCFEELVFEEDLSDHQKEMDERHTGKEGHYERRLKRKDGTGIWTLVSSKAIFGDSGEFLGSFGMFTDNSLRKAIENDLREINDLLDSISEAQSAYIAKGDSNAVFNKLLSILVRLTKSEFGFLDEVLKDEGGSTYKLNLAISNIAWNDKAQRIYEDLVNRKLEFRNLDNLNGLPAKTGEIVISNNPHTDPRSGGVPEGHPEIKNFMGIPLYFGGELVGVAGIANSAYGYSEEIASFLKPFLSACSSIIYAFRNELKRKALLENLIESEDKFKSIFMNAPLLIALTNPEDGKYIEVNNEFLKVTGYSKEDVIGRTSLELNILKPIDREIINRFIRNTEEIINFEMVINTKSGNELICLFNADVINIGGVKQLLSIAQDITQRKIAEKALGESEEKYKTIFDTAPTVIISINTSGIILDCNNKIKNISGYETYDVIGRKFENFILPVNISFAENSLNEIKTIGNSKNKEYKLVCKNGEVIDVLINSSSIRGNRGEFTGSLCFIDDITEFKRINREIEEQREQLRMLGQYIEMVREEEKSEIAYLIHDDIGQALTIMKLTLKLLQDEIEFLNTTALDYLSQLNDTIDSTLEKARIISSELRPPILDHLGLLAAIEWQAEEFTKRSQIKSIFVKPDDFPETDDFVSLILFRMLQEILANIARHSKATEVNINIELSEENIVLIISDNGIGIEQSKISDPKSFGLMAIRERAKVIRGNFSIVGIKDKGTVVKIIAPLEGKRND